MTHLALKSIVCCIIIFEVLEIHICVAIYSIRALLERNSSLLREVGLESPPSPINCLLPLKGMRGADVIGHYESLRPPVFLLLM